MSMGGVGQGDALWQEAVKLVRNDVGTSTQPLTDEEFDHLVAVANSGTGIDADKQAFLAKLASPAFTLELRNGSAEKPGFDVAGFAFGDVNAERLQTIDRAIAGRGIGSHSLGAPANTVPLTKQAAATEVDLSSPHGRLAALDRFSQNAQGAAGLMSCNATSYVALATYAGPEGLTGLCDAIISEWPNSESAKTAARVKVAVNASPPTLTLKDLGDLAQALYQPWEQSEAAQGDDNPGVAAGTIHDFVTRHADQLGPLFAAGDVIGVDTDGDGMPNHATALFGPPDNLVAAYDPGEMTDGHHVRQGADIGQYQAAMFESLLHGAK